MGNIQYIFENKWKKKNKRAVLTRCNGPQRVWLSVSFRRRLPRERKSWANFSGLERHWASEPTVISSSQASSSLHEWRKLNFWSWKLSHLEEVSKGLLSGVTSVAQIFAGWLRLPLLTRGPSVSAKQRGREILLMSTWEGSKGLSGGAGFEPWDTQV